MTSILRNATIPKPYEGAPRNFDGKILFSIALFFIMFNLKTFVVLKMMVMIQEKTEL